jgi:hypothetical protein
VLGDSIKRDGSEETIVRIAQGLVVIEQNQIHNQSRYTQIAPIFSTNFYGG